MEHAWAFGLAARDWIAVAGLGISLGHIVVRGLIAWRKPRSGVKVAAWFAETLDVEKLGAPRKGGLAFNVINRRDHAINVTHMSIAHLGDPVRGWMSWIAGFRIEPHNSVRQFVAMEKAQLKGRFRVVVTLATGQEFHSKVLDPREASSDELPAPATRS